MSHPARTLPKPNVRKLQGLHNRKTFGLRLLATSDLHVHITPWDYYADRRSEGEGLARTASLIAAARAEVKTSLLLDNGDFLQGSPMGDYEVLKADKDQIHPMIAAMNLLGYDAATLGNHEFSNGLDFLLARMAQATFPLVSANVIKELGADPLQDVTLVPPTLILTRQVEDGEGNTRLLRIGVIGLAPPQTTMWGRQQLGDAIKTRDILETAVAYVPKLRASGADIVVALSHSGIGQTEASDNMENATAALAAVPGIDALIAGHTHQKFPSSDFAAVPGIDPVAGRLWGKPAVMPGFHGSHLGVIDLDLVEEGGAWHVAGSRSELRPIARRTRTGRLTAMTKSAPDIMGLADKAHRATRRWSQIPVGHSPRPLHSFFALMSPCASVRLIAKAQAERVAQALRGGPYAGLPMVSAAAPFHAGGRGGPQNYTMIDEGALMMRHAADLYPHPNTLAALIVTGAELALWLERSFSLYNQIAPGAQDADLINADFPSFNFDMIEGLTWEVDLTQPARFNTHGAAIQPESRRILDLRHDGKVIDPEARFVLATNSYRASGSGNFAGALPDRQILSTPESSRDMLLAYLTRLGTLPDIEPDNWVFRPMPGTSVVFESAPEAAAHLHCLHPARVEALDLNHEGFQRFRLHL